MTLAEKYSDNFTPEARDAGQALFDAHAVSVLMAAPDSITTEIADEKDYRDTRWTVAANRLAPQCDCDLFASRHQLCSHLWAAILAADANGELLQALKHNVPRRIVINAAAAPDDGLTYQPDVKTPRRRTPPPPKPTSTYLDRTDAQSAGWLTKSKRPPQPFQVPQPGTLPQQTDIIFILKLENQRPDALALNVAWRPFAAPGAPPPPAKSMVFSPDMVVDSPVLAKALSWQPSLPPTSEIAVPTQHIRDFLDSLDNHNLIRWMATSQKPARIHPVAPCLTRGISFRIDWSQEAADSIHPYFAARGFFDAPAGNIPLERVLFVWQNGLVLTQDTIFLADLRGQYPLAASMAGKPPRMMSLDAARDLARTLFVESKWPAEDFPEQLRPTVAAPAPTPRLFVRTARYKFQGKEQLHAELSFDYAGTIVDATDKAELVQNEKTHAVVQRNATAENGFVLCLQSLGFRWNDSREEEEIGWKLPPALLDTAVRTLVTQDWFVSAQGKDYRKPTTKTAVIVSRIDWFELDGSVSFDGFTVPLPELLKARQQNKSAVRLDDGTYGLLPIEWLENFTALTEIGDLASDKIRFKQQQAAIVQALIADSTVQFDETFTRLAHDMTDTTVPFVHTSPDFKATLRPYQQDGLNWLVAMSRRGLGACLADDMGLGKTVQILALLDARHAARPGRPSLIVMPKSLIFNWQNEARKFTPHLKTLAYTGPARAQMLAAFPKVDLVFTTYGTLRNDVATLASFQFDTCVLDESQAIKNADSSTAEACRAIHAVFRVAMTGTPIENKLAELFSQLDFLNPGILGKILKDDPVNSPRLPKETFLKVRHAVKCFILRRTKQMVAKNLPPKTEQILWCQLDDAHQAEYDALKEHYKKQLLDGPDAGSSMDALAALLKLRQAACHPALVFQNRQFDESEKINTLAEYLVEIIGQEHKALVFSQFTTLLKFVQDKLAQLAIQFVYLDGQTQNRQTVVDKFQQDDNIKVFLISLKAGGVGLNLTAADYIFLLDPWWNPATEAQAIDRAFRIGQTRPVFAYRLITKNTIEEKVLQMQNAKRKLADTYLKETPEPASLSQDDIRFLLA